MSTCSTREVQDSNTYVQKAFCFQSKTVGNASRLCHNMLGYILLFSFQFKKIVLVLLTITETKSSVNKWQNSAIVSWLFYFILL